MLTPRIWLTLTQSWHSSWPGTYKNVDNTSDWPQQQLQTRAIINKERVQCACAREPHTTKIQQTIINYKYRGRGRERERRGLLVKATQPHTRLYKLGCVGAGPWETEGRKPPSTGWLIVVTPTGQQTRILLVYGEDTWRCPVGCIPRGQLHDTCLMLCTVL